MRRRTALSGLAASVAGLVLPLTCAAAELGVMPVSVQLDREHARAVLRVVNLGREPATVQADALLWQRQAGRDIEQPTKDLILSPPLFVVPPGRTQVLRVGLRGGFPVDEGRAYRLVLRELPPAPASEPRTAGQVRVLVAMRLPVLVAPQQARDSESWSASRSADGQVAAEVVNHGNGHLKVGSLRLLGEDDATVVERHVGLVLFPGERRRFPFEGAYDAGMPLKLEVRGEQQVRHVAVAAARN